MGIREQGYRHWEGTYTGHAFRWWTITKAGLRQTVYTKGRLLTLILLMAVAWIFPFFFGVFYFFGELSARASDPDEFLRNNLYEMLLAWQWMWGVVFSAVIGSRLVANDLRSDALYIYLAKPIRRFDYIIGKMLTCFIWVTGVTLAPALWVYLAAIGTENKLLPFADKGEIFWETVAVYGVFILLLSIGSVTFSAFTKRWTLALIAWIGFFFLLAPIGVIAAEASKTKEWLYLSPVMNLFIYAEHMWEGTPDPLFTPDWVPALWILLGLVAACLTAFVIRILRLEVSE